MPKRVKKGSWITYGGAGEHAVATCTRCGDVLRMVLPQHMEVFLAASDAYIKVHERCEVAPHEPNLVDERDGREI